MRAGDGGYRLPDQPTVPAMRCLQVWIPNDDRYLEAFASQYQELATWLVWQRDGTNRAALAAESWKDAVERSYESGDWLTCPDCEDCEECEECMDCCDELRERIRQIENELFQSDCEDCEMSKCGCGCGCGNQTININVTQADPETPVYEPELPDTPPANEPLDDYKCGASHYLAYVTRMMLINAFDWTGTYNSWVSMFNNFFQWLTGFDGGFVYGIYAAVISWVAGLVDSERIIDVYQENEQVLVCAMYNASTEADAWAIVNARLMQAYAYNSVHSALVRAMMSVMPYSALFAALPLSALPPAFRSRDCSCSPESPEDWPNDVPNYEWRLGGIARQETPDPSTTLTQLWVDGARYTLTITDASTSWNEDIIASPPPLAAGERVAGWTWLIVESETSGGINDPGSGHVQIEDYSGVPPRRKLEYVAGDEELLNAVAFDATVTVTQTEMNAIRNLDLYCRVGAGQSPPGNGLAEVRAILWAIALP